MRPRREKIETRGRRIAPFEESRLFASRPALPGDPAAEAELLREFLDLEMRRSLGMPKKIVRLRTPRPKKVVGL